MVVVVEWVVCIVKPNESVERMEMDGSMIGRCVC